MRKVLFKLLGTKYYLRTLHSGFHLSYSINALKSKEAYRYHYFDKKIIQPGDYIIDIGANLGYYTKLFAKWTGEKGHVFAVEPVSVFADTIKWGTKNFKNITVYNCALGEEEKEVKLSTPGKYGYIRTGLPNVMSEDDLASDYEFTFTAAMKMGSKLFADISKLDFIKCDIEGYEEYVLPEIKDLLIKFKPIIQVETWGDHKPKVESFLTGIGYEIYDIENEILKRVNEIKNKQEGDLFFIHKENNGVIERLKKINAA